MKKTFLIAIVLLTVGMLGCQKEMINKNINQNSTKAVFSGPSDVKPGPVSLNLWKIGSFIVNNEDLTRRFISFTIELNPDNSATARNENLMIPGKWEIVNNQYFFYFDIDNAVVTKPPYDYDLSIFNELNGNWDILKEDPSTVLLEMSINKIYKQLRLDKLVKSK